MLTEAELSMIRAYATGTYATSNGPLTKHAEQHPSLELMPPDRLLALLAHIDALTAALAAERARNSELIDVEAIYWRALTDVLIGAQQQSQSHADVIALMAGALNAANAIVPLEQRAGCAARQEGEYDAR